MVAFEDDFSKEMIDYKFCPDITKSPNITKSLYDITSNKNTHPNEVSVELRLGQRFSKAMLVYAAKHNIHIFFHFDHMQNIEQMVDRSYKNSSGPVPSGNSEQRKMKIHHTVTASELRYVFRFWSKSEDPALGSPIDLKRQNHERVYKHIGDGFKGKVTFLLNGKGLSKKKVKKYTGQTLK